TSMTCIEPLRFVPEPSTAPVRTLAPSVTIEREPIMHSSSPPTGAAFAGATPPPIPTPPDKCTFLPIWAHEPTVAQVSTIVPSSTYAPIFVNDGISTTLRPISEPRRAITGGTTQKPLAAKSASVYDANLLGTLS